MSVLVTRGKNKCPGESVFCLASNMHLAIDIPKLNNIEQL